MKIRKTILTMALILCIFSSLTIVGTSVSAYNIKVIAVDGRTAQPINHSEIFVYDTNNTLIAHNFTNVFGEYTFSLPNGTYRFEAYNTTESGYQITGELSYIVYGNGTTLTIFLNPTEIPEVVELDIIDIWLPIIAIGMFIMVIGLIYITRRVD